MRESGSTPEAGLVESQHRNSAEVAFVVDEGGAIGNHRVVDGVPVAPECVRHIVDVSTRFTNRPRRLTPCSIADGRQTLLKSEAPVCLAQRVLQRSRRSR